MAEKKLLTYEGLEEYNIKWHERLQAIVIGNDDINDIFIDSMMQNYTWSYEFDTVFGFEQIPTAYGIAIRHPWYYTTLDYSYVLGAIPFSLFGSEDASMTVDWGDGTVETLTSADYQSRVICPSSIHEYANPGTYTISVTSSNWNQIYISGGCVSIGYYGAGSMPWRAVYDDRVTQEKHNEPDYSSAAHPDLQGDYRDTIQNMMSLMRFGLKKILNPLPKLAGTLVSENYNNLSDYPDVDYEVDEGTYTGIPEFVGIPMYGTKLQNQLYFVFDDSHILGNNYPSDIFTYNNSLEIIGAFGEIDEVDGVKTPHVTVFEEESTKVWQELPIQDNACNTADTIYLAFGNNFKYEPSGSGTKQISIVNSNKEINSTRFRLEIIDGGDFLIEWADNISWKNNSEPQFQQYHTDVLMFETHDEGKTWIGEVTQSTAMTPYWKFKLMPKNFDAGDWYDPEEAIYMIIPIDAAAIEYVDWGDGTIEEAPFSSDSLNEYGFLKHGYYNSAQMFGVTIKSTKFNTGYILTEEDMTGSMEDFRRSLIEIVNPLPAIKGAYCYNNQTDDTEQTDNTLCNVLYGYKNLVSLPDYFFKNNLYPIGGKCFYSCSSLKSIPFNSFVYDTNTINFSQCFYGCTSLQAIPSGLFDNCTAAENFTNCFYNCHGITSIPSGLFANCTAAENFTNCFYNCTSLVSVPSGLFANCTAAENFTDCFYNCTSLVSVPSGLFANCTAVTNFTSCFERCTALTSIPSGLFDNCTAAKDFTKCFCYCTSLTSIPSGLFDDCTAATTFANCFSQCSLLTIVPSGLFDKNTAVTNFGYCFNLCSSLASIPSGLFDKCTAVTTFQNCFSQCSSITSIPSGLFDKCTAVTSFYSCFSSCTSLASIPTGLFDKNTVAINLDYCFSNCTSLASIPTGLFDKNTAVTSFYYCFNNCSSITSIPENLFKYNTAVKKFDYCFRNCTNLGSFTVHIGSSSVTSCSSFVTSKSGTTRTIYVPSGSTTQTRFKSVASGLGLSIVGE